MNKVEQTIKDVEKSIKTLRELICFLTNLWMHVVERGKKTFIYLYFDRFKGKVKESTFQNKNINSCIECRPETQSF